MNHPIEGFRDEAEGQKVDLRKKEFRHLREGAPELRADTRQETRPDSVRAAELRAQEIIDSLGDSIYQSDEFFIDHADIPQGWAYQWRRQTVAGKEDPHYMVGLRRSGWTEVPVSRHPEMMPIGWTGAIEKKGLVLMEMPKILVDRANAAAKREAEDQVRNSEAMLHETPANTGPREEFPDKMKYAKREFVAPPRSSDAA
jgi:hypothetical protein